MYHVYYSEKINDKNKGKLLTIYAVYICCGFCTCILEEKKLIKQKKITSQREREREVRTWSSPECLEPAGVQRERERDVERERERQI
jgi:hypothetical protein